MIRLKKGSLRFVSKGSKYNLFRRLGLFQNRSSGWHFVTWLVFREFYQPHGRPHDHWRNYLLAKLELEQRFPFTSRPHDKFRQGWKHKVTADERWRFLLDFLCVTLNARIVAKCVIGNCETWIYAWGCWGWRSYPQKWFGSGGRISESLCGISRTYKTQSIPSVNIGQI